MLSVRGRRRIAIFVIILFLSNASISLAIDDGFGPARKIEGKYFKIYYTPQLEVSSLTQQLNVNPSDRLLAGNPSQIGASIDAEFANMLDTLFIQICGILDMHLYSFQGNIKVCLDAGQLKKIFKDLFGADLKTYSFYVHNLNTIYISAENFKRNIIVHEIAHAIVSHYFVVLPPEKIQEVLAGYVEYQLRKTPQ